MKSHDVNEDGATIHLAGQAKKPWVTPSLLVIALASAEGGTIPSSADGAGSNSNIRRRS
jgi:hypothetical protein